MYHFCLLLLHDIYWCPFFLHELKLPCEVICFYLEELPLAFLIMWIFQQQNPSALDYLRNSTLPSFLKYRFTGYRILVNRFSFFFFLSAPYKCYPIAFWPPSFLLKSLLPKLKELPLSDTSFFSWCFQYLSLTSIIFTMIYLFVDPFVFTANWILKKFLDM